MSDRWILFRLRACGLLLAAVTTSHAMGGSVVFVDDDAPPGGDGTSWDTAYSNLQDAIADALRGGVTEIRVAQGLYVPSDTPFDTKNPRFFTFLFVNGVELRGGYAGQGAPDPDARDIALYETVLSGDLEGNDGPGFQNYEENVYHVVSTDTAVDQTAVLDGFTVTAGNADAYTGIAMGGGGLIVLSSPVLRSCTFRQNAAAEFGGALSFLSSNPTIIDCNFFENGESPNMQDPLRGGAVYVRDGMTTISGCVFEANGADVGGALFVEAGMGQPTIDILDCTFSGNEGIAGHGGIHFDDTTATVIDCTFQDHVALGTGAIFAKNSSIAVERCYFANNHADEGNSTDGGGALLLSQSLAASFVDCVFFRNSSTNPGGAVRFSGAGPLTLERCVFLGNSSTVVGGGLLSHSATSMTNCMFVANMAPQGAGIVVCGSDQIAITSSSFVANEATQAGGGISIGTPCNSGDAVLVDSVLWGNTVGGKQDEDAQILVGERSTVTVDFSCIQGITGRFGGVGNIGDDPMFVQHPDPGPDGEWGTDDDEFGDLRLTPGSPCIDAADNTALGLIGITVDLDGNPRFIDDPKTNDTGLGDCPIVDMGSYEFQGTCPWDLDCNGSVGVGDLLILLGNWDNPYGVGDLLALLANWGPCP